MSARDVSTASRSPSVAPAGQGRPPLADLGRAILLTCARPGEAAAAKVADVDKAPRERLAIDRIESLNPPRQRLVQDFALIAALKWTEVERVLILDTRTNSDPLAGASGAVLLKMRARSILNAQKSSGMAEPSAPRSSAEWRADNDYFAWRPFH